MSDIVCFDGFLVSPVMVRRGKLCSALLEVAGSTCNAELIDVAEYIARDVKRDFLSVACDDESQVSYARTESDYHNSKRRVKLSLSRYLARNFPALHSRVRDDYVFAVMERLLGADYGFSIVRGDDLLIAYASGPPSCMGGDDESAERVQFWADNPDQVGLIILTIDRKIVARALLWRNEFHDRIYAPNAEVRAKVESYILRHNLSDVNSAELTLTMLPSSNGQYPYADSMQYAKELPDGKIRLSNRKFAGCETLRGTRGENPFDGSEECSSCGDRVSSDDARHQDGDCYCESCFDDRFSYCETCDEYADSSDFMMIHNRRGHEIYICGGCAESMNIITCPCCQESFVDE